MSKIIVITIFLILFLGAGIYVGSNYLFSFYKFEFGFEPYGESINQITDLQKISFTNPQTINKEGSLIYESKYWNIEQKDTGGFSYLGLEPRNEKTFSGSDLKFNSATPQSKGSPGNLHTTPTTQTILISKEDFSQRDFKSNFIFFGGTLSNQINSYNFFGANSLSISLVGDSGEVNAMSYYISGVGKGITGSGPATNIPETNVVIHPRVIDNVVEVYFNGEKTKEISYVGNYKLKISTTSHCGSVCDVFTTMENPSYKQDFGCTIKPGEQFYSSIFKEGEVVNINKLNNFKKFCLDETPMTIYSNVGSTTDSSILADLVNVKEFKVPQGQIWRVDYIGDLSFFRTECEAGEIYNNEEDACMTRAVLTTIIEGEFGDEQVIEVETAPIKYNLPIIETHQELENYGLFRFVHAKEDSQDVTPNYFFIGDSKFNSVGLTYLKDIQTNLNYPEDKSNWIASFSLNGRNYNAIDGIVFIDNYLSVDLTDVHGRYHKDSKSVEDFKLEYTFDLNTEFLDIDYKEGKIIVSNNYRAFDGGIILTTKNNIGITEIKKLDKTLIIGDTSFYVDSANLLEIKARPFIKIQIPSYEYNLDTKNAINIKNINEEAVVNYIEETQPNDSIFTKITAWIKNIFQNWKWI
jgi:hypothetical protein